MNQNTNLVIIPTYNEAENIKSVIEAIFAATCAVDILVVDDGSPDGTGRLVKALQKTWSENLFLLERHAKQGLAGAYLAGFRYGLARGYQQFIEMDADLSHPPQSLPSMLGHLQKSKVVVGSRYVAGGGTENWGLIRRWISRGGSLYARCVLQVPVGDLTGGFNGWHRSVLEAIQLETIESNGYAFQIELKFRAYLMGFSILEFPIIFHDRVAGASKMSPRIVWEAIFKVWKFLKLRKKFAKKETYSGLRTSPSSNS